MSIYMRQLIIARKDLQMSPGKLAAQCCHASAAFIIERLKNSPSFNEYDDNGEHIVKFTLTLDTDIYWNWIDTIATKTICEAKTKKHLLKAVDMANELGLKEGKDFFLIRDMCLTELEPEEVDENGGGSTLTCIGFRPLPDEIAHKISKKFQLYK